MNTTLHPSQQLAQVLLPLALDGCYSYTIPPGMQVVEGSYVYVPLGPRSVIGVVWKLGGEPPAATKLRAIKTCFDMPPMADSQRRLIDWVARYYLEQPGQVLRLALRVPAAFNDAPQISGYALTDTVPERLTPQRQKVLDAAIDCPALPANDLAQLAGVGVSVIKGLAKQGALKQVALPVLQDFQEPDTEAVEVTLSSQQTVAADYLCEAVRAGKFSTTLIDGVTGSGKTEVYFEAMAQALRAGKQVVLLLPEIALTNQFMERVERRFQTEPAEWHSDLRPRQRERVWRAVAKGQAKIVVGARSALFLPWANLGLIVVDEEHEPAFKQGEGVNYQARDVAVVYGATAGFPVVLASATPSLETVVNAETGRYGIVKLPARHGGAQMPQITLIDNRTTPPENGQWLSAPLMQAMSETLNAGEQVLLFLNRRGYAPLTLCRVCGHRLQCPNCQSWLVEHRFKNRLICHHCGHGEPVPDVCPGCQNFDSLVPCGPGVERLAEEAAAKFPDARIVVLSSDLMRGTALKTTLRDIADGQYNLIVGTQLVAKGHHFPNLTLAGIVDADLALESNDPRASERSWQLLAQVAGRTGRAEKSGRALIQTYLPDHPLMQALQAGDRQAYLDYEKTLRKSAHLPPFGLLAGLIISGTDMDQTARFARALAQRIPAAKNIQVLGPAPAPLALLNGRYRFRYLVMSGRDIDLQAFLHSWLDGVSPRGSLKLNIDIDPYNFL